MFDDYYVRLPIGRLDQEAERFSSEGLKPEISLGTATLAHLSVAEIRRHGRTLRRFASHTLHAPFIDISPGAQDDEVRAISLAKMEKVMALGQQWGSRLAVMHYNFDPIYYRHSFDGWLQRARQFYLHLLSGKGGTLIALENVADPTPHVAGRLVEAAAHPRLIHCLDLGHHHVFSGIPVDQWLLRLHPSGHIHFHFHDNDGKEDEHLPLGRGTIRWERVKKLVSKLACPFTVGLEPHTRRDEHRTLAFYKKNFLQIPR